MRATACGFSIFEMSRGGDFARWREED